MTTYDDARKARWYEGALLMQFLWHLILSISECTIRHLISFVGGIDLNTASDSMRRKEMGDVLTIGYCQQTVTLIIPLHFSLF